MVTRSKSGIFKPKVYITTLTNKEPNIVQEALSDQNWHQVMRDECEALFRNKTWSLVQFSEAYKVVDSKWVFRIKQNTDGSVTKYKARLVAKGFQQTEGVDYFETFSLVVKACTVRIIFSLAVMNKRKIRQVDVNNAFLNGELTEDVYMYQLKGLINEKKSSYVCKLKKALYGLKQAPRAWYDKLKNCLISNWGLQNSRADTSLFFKEIQGSIILVLIYVDDILITGPDSGELKKFILEFSKTFALKDLGILSYFFGIEVSYADGCMYLSQRKYINDLLSKADMLHCKGCDTPIVTGLKLQKEVKGYLAPTLQHIMACKRVLRYLKETMNYGLKFSAGGEMEITSFIDADWACDIDDKKSIGAYCIYFGNNLVSWSSKKQSMVTMSSTESEYRALASTITAAGLILGRALRRNLAAALIETQSLAWLFDDWRLWLASEVEEMAEDSSFTSAASPSSVSLTSWFPSIFLVPILSANSSPPGGSLLAAADSLPTSFDSSPASAASASGIIPNLNTYGSSPPYAYAPVPTLSSSISNLSSLAPSPSPSPPTPSSPSPPTPPPLPPTQTHQMITRSRNNIYKPKRLDRTTLAPIISSIHCPPPLNRLDLVPPVPCHNLIGCKWVFRVKSHPDGSVDMYKARLVAKGFTQRLGLDYHDTFSLVVKTSTVRVIFCLALQFGWPVRQLDINNAFLNGSLDEEVYMKQPPGFIDSNRPSFVCRLRKSLYGLKQAPRAWFTTLYKFLLSYGFRQSRIDASLFLYHRDGHRIYFLVYVDDLIITSSQGRHHDVRSLLDRFGMTDAKPIATPLSATVGLQQTDGFVSADGGNLDDRSSMSACTIFFGGNPITWSSKKQKSMACSSTEVDFHAIASTISELCWLRHLFSELGLLSVAHVPSMHQLADVLTKLLPRLPFERARSKLGVLDSTPLLRGRNGLV
ncbi:hypothetical protein KPL70_008338 [Citrus sinensis]|nr:hypothetical protein KPL70_008338 [Citrus sinensis]